jgi:hypothetical protein
MSNGANANLTDDAEAGAPRPIWRQLLVEREVNNPYLRTLLHLAIPVAASLVLHALVVALLGLKEFTIPGPPGAPVGEYEAGLVESLGDMTARAFDWSATDPLSELAADEPQEPYASLAPLDAPSDSLGELDIGDDALDPGPGAGDELGLGLGEGALSILGTGAGGLAETGAGGLGAGGLGGGGLAGMAGMWGLRFPTNRIVYVVDFSGSVTAVVDQIRRELKRSIAGLKPTQEFNVIIFFTTGGGQDEKIRTEAFQSESLAAATPENRRRFAEWIDRWAPMGYTKPVEALRRAIALQPDVILFHSDGNFEDREAQQINDLNRATRIKIFSLVFDELLLGDASGLPPQANEGVRRMRRIAESNGGQMRIVTAGDLKRTRR